MCILFRSEQLVFTPCSACGYVNCREYPFLCQRPVELYLAIAGPLELLEDDVVHAGARLDQGGGDYSERTAPVFRGYRARRAEERLRLRHRRRVQAAAQSPSGAALDRVESATHPGDGIEDDDDVLAQLHESPRPLEHHL